MPRYLDWNLPFRKAQDILDKRSVRAAFLKKIIILLSLTLILASKSHNMCSISLEDDLLAFIKTNISLAKRRCVT